MKTLLIVDDEEDLLVALELVLEPNYAVRRASDGRAALAVLESEPIDAVVLDLMMPVMDGASFLRALATRNIDVPVVIASARPDAVELGEQLKVAGLLSKPYSGEELETVLARVLH